jgi:hypothetical protein
MDERNVLKWFFRNWMLLCELGTTSYSHVVGSCEHDNEPSGSIKGGEAFDHLSHYHFLKITFLQGLNWLFI